MDLWERSVTILYLALDLGHEMAGCNLCVALQKLGRFEEAVLPSERCIQNGLRLLGQFLFAHDYASLNVCLYVGRFGIEGIGVACPCPPL
jgi:hypothetical protein